MQSIQKRLVHVKVSGERDQGQGASGRSLSSTVTRESRRRSQLCRKKPRGKPLLTLSKVDRKGRVSKHTPRSLDQLLTRLIVSQSLLLSLSLSLTVEGETVTRAREHTTEGKPSESGGRDRTEPLSPQVTSNSTTRKCSGRQGCLGARETYKCRKKGESLSGAMKRAVKRPIRARSAAQRTDSKRSRESVFVSASANKLGQIEKCREHSGGDREGEEI